MATRPEGRHIVHQEGLATKTSSGQSVTVPVEDYWQWYLIANLTVGIPAQQMRVAIDFYSPDLQLIGVNATIRGDYDCGDDSSDCYEYANSDGSSDSSDDKNEYNASASSTSYSNGANFTSYWNSGVVVSDIVNIHGLVSNMTFGSLSYVNDWDLPYIPADGYLGLAPYPSQSNITTVLNQLVPSLDKPLVSIRLQRDIDDGAGNKTVAQISFGSNQLGECQNGNSLKLGLNSVEDSSLPPTFNATGFTIVNANASDACASNAVQAAHPIMIVDFFFPIFCSIQLQELFVSASGAYFNNDEKVVPAGLLPDGQCLSGERSTGCWEHYDTTAG